MTPTEAAVIIGVQVSAVREAIRNQALPAKKIPTNNNQFGYVYDISMKAATKYRDEYNPSHLGWPRGKKRPTKKRSKR